MHGVLRISSVLNQGITGIYVCVKGFFEIYNGQTKSFKVVGLVPGAKYCFRLRAYNEVGESEWSRISHYTTKAQIPKMPKCLRVVDANSTVSSHLSSIGFHLSGLIV